ncbi:MAG TPA: phosphoenolpyruvate carboxykinase (GTP), partial [Rhabdochlamydiaceae bacterium]
IAWMHIGKDGRLYAINPEAGFFGVAPGTNEASNPNAMRIIEKNTIFTNTAVTEERDVWWEGLTKEPPPHLLNWLGEPWVPGTPASHPNARFTSPLSQCTILDPDWNNPEGVPISAILFGGRRASLEPLVYESFSWQHGVFVGASLSSETTAAAKGAVGTLRHDPFAMLPFCGYNMGDYFQHWLNMQKQAGAKLPKIFHVNWFRKSKEGKYLWPGFGENIHVLKWIFERVSGTAQARESFVGHLPAPGLFAEELLSLDPESWKKEVAELKHYFKIFGSHLPDAVRAELDALEKRIS